VTIMAELGSITRFDTPRQLMGYSGAVPSENSSGKRKQRGSITISDFFRTPMQEATANTR
jgi:transposase